MWKQPVFARAPQHSHAAHLLKQLGIELLSEALLLDRAALLGRAPERVLGELGLVEVEVLLPLAQEADDVQRVLGRARAAELGLRGGSRSGPWSARVVASREDRKSVV